MAAQSALAATPTWYTNGTGGNNPNIPDFYQHQDWSGFAPASANGWEPSGGWCAYTAYADVFYDLTQQGYQKLYTATGTTPTPANWMTAMYGGTGGTATTTAQVQASDIYKLQNSILSTSGNIQNFLNATANAGTYAATGGSLTSNFYQVSAGSVSYTPAGGTAATNADVMSFTNYYLKDMSAEVLYRLNQGTAAFSAAGGTAQGCWWGRPNKSVGGGNYHYVAVAGISPSLFEPNTTVLVADPDTNLGSGPICAGWPTVGFVPTGGTNGGFPFSSPAGAPLPVVANASPLSQGFTGFNIASSGKATITSANSPQYNGMVVQGVSVIYANPVKSATTSSGAGPGDTKTGLALTLPPSYGAVDGVLHRFPSSLTDTAGTDASDFSFTDISDGSAMWTSTPEPSDPFGNPLPDLGEEFNLGSGSATALEPGETALLDLGTADSFVAGGYDILLHFQGDPADVWLPEMTGGTTLDPSDAIGDQSVPEPSSMALACSGLAAAAIVRWRRRRVRFPPPARRKSRPCKAWFMRRGRSR